MANGRGNGRMSLSMKLIRLVIVLFNLAFVILGSLLLALGIFVLKDPKMQHLRPLLDPNITTKATQTLSSIEVFAIVLVVIGGILLLIGFLGKKKRHIDKNDLISTNFLFRLLRSSEKFSMFTYDLCDYRRFNNSS